MKRDAKEVRRCLAALYHGGNLAIERRDDGFLLLRPKGLEGEGPSAVLDPETGRWRSDPAQPERSGFVALGRHLGLELSAALSPWL